MHWSRRMSFTDRARAALWRVPVGLQLSALYTLLLVAILTLLGGALYTQLDRFLVQNTVDRLEQAAAAALAPSPVADYEGRHDSGPGGRPHYDGPNTGAQPPTAYPHPPMPT